MRASVVPKVVNIDTPSWSPDQAARELQRYIDEGVVKAVVIGMEFTDESAKEDGIVFDWIGSKQNYNERVYLITWLWQRMMQRIFGVRA